MVAAWGHFPVQLQFWSGPWNAIQFLFGSENFQYNYNLGLGIVPNLAQGFGLHKQFHSHMVLATPLGLAIQFSLGGAGDTIGSGNSAQCGSGNSIRMVLATPLGQAIQLSVGGVGDTIGYGNSDKFGSGNSIQFQFGSENTYLYQ